jgi:hypothetical protein
MRWILLAVGILLGVVMVVFAIGALLPRKHHATRRAQFRQPREAVWQAITDYEKFPEWRPTVKRVEPVAASGGKPAWRETDSHGQVLPMEVTEWMPPGRMAAHCRPQPSVRRHVDVRDRVRRRRERPAHHRGRRDLQSHLPFYGALCLRLYRNDG